MRHISFKYLNSLPCEMQTQHINDNLKHFEKMKKVFADMENTRKRKNKSTLGNQELSESEFTQ